MTMKNNLKKAHVTTRTAATAKAGRRAGSKALPPTEKANMNKVRWMVDQVTTGSSTFKAAFQRCHASDLEITKAEQFMQVLLTKDTINPVVKARIKQALI